jgi:hypothetical protein
VNILSGTCFCTGCTEGTGGEVGDDELEIVFVSAVITEGDSISLRAISGAMVVGCGDGVSRVDVESSKGFSPPLSFSEVGKPVKYVGKSVT